jgi:hypothetical protein
VAFAALDLPAEELQPADDHARACASGTTTSMQLFAGVNHDGIVAAGGPAATAWFDDRLAGIPAPSDC